MIITSTAADGKRYEIDIVKTKAREGTVRIKSWKAGNKSSKPSTDDTTRLYDIKATKSGGIIQCFARVFGPDPVVGFAIGAGHLGVSIKGALAGNGVTQYSVSVSDLTALRTYVVACGFPVMK